MQIPKTTPLSDRWSFLSRIGPRILALVPFALLLYVLAEYAVLVPFWDQWELVPLLEKTYQGDLTFYDLWAQHNEHRIIFPKLIMLGLARLTGWNIGYELAVIVMLACAIFLVFAQQVKMTGRKLGIAGMHWAAPLIALVVFSISQFENWLWGWQIQMPLNLLAVIGGIMLLANELFSWKKFAGAAVLGIVATYSFANGILFWPIGSAIVFVALSGRPQRKNALITWLAISVLVLGSYFYHYEKPEGNPGLELIFKLPFEYVCYVLKYTGNTGIQNLGGNDYAVGSLALVCGLAAIIGFLWSGGMLLRKNIADVRTLLPYLGVSLYSVGSALITGAGRVGFGSNQAISSRYSLMAAPLWVSLIVFLVLLMRSNRRNADDGLQKAPARKCHGTMALPSLIVVVLILIVGSVSSVKNAKLLAQLQATGRTGLVDLAANPGGEVDYDRLSLLYPRPGVVVERYPILLRHRLSVFKEPKPSDPK